VLCTGNEGVRRAKGLSLIKIYFQWRDTEQDSSARPVYQQVRGPMRASRSRPCSDGAKAVDLAVLETIVHQFGRPFDKGHEAAGVALGRTLPGFSGNPFGSIFPTRSHVTVLNDFNNLRSREQSQG
jgi:hypothetical protein